MAYPTAAILAEWELIDDSDLTPEEEEAIDDMERDRLYTWENR